MPRTPKVETLSPKVVSFEERPVTLDEVLVAFQKTLSRARSSADRYANSEIAFAVGQKTLYTIDHLDLELAAAFQPATNNGKDIDFISVNFEPNPETRSLVRFHVSAKPLEPVSESSLRLAELERHETEPDIHRIHVMLLGSVTRGGKTTIEGISKSTIHFVIAAVDQQQAVNISTAGGQNAGTATVEIDVKANRVKVGSQTTTLSDLKLIEAVEFSVFATSIDPPATSNVLTFKKS